MFDIVLEHLAAQRLMRVGPIVYVVYLLYITYYILYVYYNILMFDTVLRAPGDAATDGPPPDRFISYHIIV